MLNYTDKEAKAIRLELGKEAKGLRSRIRGTKYPDIDVRECMSDVFAWAQRANSLNQVLSRANNLMAFTLFNIGDYNNGEFDLTEDQLDLAYDIDAFCIKCRKVVQEGGVNPDNAWSLHDGSFAPKCAARQAKTRRRVDSGYNRDLATKESVADFKASQREKKALEYETLVSTGCVEAVPVAEGFETEVETILTHLNTRVGNFEDDNFSLTNEDARGGVIFLFDTPSGLRVRAFDYQHLPTSKYPEVARIFIKKPLIYADPEGFCYGASYIDVVYPVINAAVAGYEIDDEWYAVQEDVAAISKALGLEDLNDQTPNL